jgi:hypothetical protein
MVAMKPEYEKMQAGRRGVRKMKRKMIGKMRWLVAALGILVVAGNNTFGAYSTGFVWNLTTDFNSAMLPAESNDAQNKMVWQYYNSAGMNYNRDLDWRARQPQNMPQFNTLLADGTGYCDSSDNEANGVHYRIWKDTSVVPHVIKIWNLNTRVLGVRWLSPVDGIVSVSGNMGHPVFNGYLWAIDVYNNGKLVRDVAKGLVGADSPYAAPVPFSISENIRVKEGDMICLTEVESVFYDSPLGGTYGVGTQFSTGYHAYDYHTIDLNITLQPGPTDCQQIGFYDPGDINHDCIVNVKDFCQIAQSWLKCNDPQGSNCQFSW